MLESCIFCCQIVVSDDNGFAEQKPDIDSFELPQLENNPKFVKEDRKILQNFFSFLERYLREGSGESNKKEKKSQDRKSFKSAVKSLPSKVIACGDCLKIVKSFCDLYHDLMTIQLLLNWQLLKLRNFVIVEDPKALNGDDGKDFRELLVEKLSLQLANSYPKLILEPVKTPDVFLAESSTPEQSLCTNSVKEEFHCESHHEDRYDEEDIKCVEKTGMSYSRESSCSPFEEQEKISPDKVLSKTEIEFQHKRGTYIKEGVWKCNFCPQVFSDKASLTRHAKLQHRKRLFYRYKCPNCKKLFAELEKLLEHLTQEQTKRPAVFEKVDEAACEVEILSFGVNPDSKAFKKLYIRDLAREKVFAKVKLPLPPAGYKYFCKCGRRFTSENDFQDHEKLHGSFTCAVCPVVKDFLPDLSVHEVRAHARKTGASNVFKCVRCGDVFFGFSGYVRHHSSVHFSLVFTEATCPICGRFIPGPNINKPLESQRWGLLDHFKREHDLNLQSLNKPEMLKCKIQNCSGYFFDLRSLSRHIKNEHGLDDLKLKEIRADLKSFVCEECGKVFKSKDNLKTHLLSHSGPDSWEFCCEICSKKCLTKQKLEAHLKTHSKEKGFVCEVCGVKYAHRHNLRIHVNSKHGDVLQDIPRKFTKRNFCSSLKGKRNVTQLDNQANNKPKRRKRIQQKESIESRDKTD